MLSTTTRRRTSLAAGLLAGAVSLGSLSACQFTSNSVSCSGSSCSVTLSGDGAKARVLGTQVTLSGVSDGRASLGVGGANVSCAEGESVSAGPLSLRCTKVTDNSVELTASLG
jgi:hypothetical protein